MIPQRWIDDLNELLTLRHVQSEKGYVFAPGEKPVGRADFEALAATPISAEEIAAFADVRGEYQLGDSRGFVIQQEERCTNWNCWMRRDANGVPWHPSEAP